MKQAKAKSPRRVEITDLVMEFQNAIIDLETGTGPRGDYAETLTAAATRLEAGIQDHVDKKVSYRLRFTEPANDNNPPARLISSADFVEGFQPPDYAIQGVVQRGFVYSMTASTGTGKTAIALLLALLTARGEDLAGLEVAKGRVVYFAGENPDDVAMRWIGICHERGLDPAKLDVHFIKERFSIPDALEAIRTQVEAIGGAGLVVVDTSAAYFTGDDENGNTALGGHARDLRALTTLPGRPCVIVPCHPTKNAANDNLLPRGGGAFIAEMDGNLTLTKVGEAVRLHWQGKHRGPDFKPILFKLQTVTAPQLVDSKGRPVPTVMAVPLSIGEPSGLAERLVAAVKGHAASVLAALDELCHDDRVVSDEEWRKHYYAKSADGSKPHTLKTRFLRAKEQLLASGAVVETAGQFSVTSRHM